MILDPGSELQSESRPSGPRQVADVRRAISAANLGHYASLLLWHVLEHPLAAACPIDGTALAETWGVHRNRVNEARRRLVRAGILAQIGDGVAFNPKFEEWVQPDGVTPLLSGRLLAYSKALPARKPRRKNQEIATPNCFTSQHQTVAIATPNRCVTQHQTVHDGRPQHQTVASHATERAPAHAELNSIQSNSTQAGLRSATASSREESQPLAAVAVEEDSDSHSRGSLDLPSGSDDGGAPDRDPALVEAIKELRRAFGPEVAKQVYRDRAAVGVALRGRWQHYREAVLVAERKVNSGGTIDKLRAFLLAVARDGAEGKVYERDITVGPRKDVSPGGPALPTNRREFSQAEIDAYHEQQRQQGERNRRRRAEEQAARDAVAEADLPPRRRPTPAELDELEANLIRWDAEYHARKKAMS